MTAFLRHLVQRSIAPANGLQPRVPSRFENTTGGIRNPPTLGEEVGERVSAAPTSTIAPAAAHQPAANVHDTRKADAPTPPSIAPTPRQSNAADFAPPPVVHPALRPLIDVTPPNVSFDSRAPAASNKPLEPAPANTASRAAAARDDLLPRPTRLLRERIVEHTRELHHETETRVVPTPNGEFPARTSPSQLPPALPSTPRTEPAASSPHITPAPAPIVNVTIGRIEITALPPPNAPLAPRAPSPGARPPRTSLEDYLKQRSRA